MGGGNSSYNKSKQVIIKDRKNQAKVNAIAEDFSFSIQGSPILCHPFFLINHTRKLFWHPNLNEPQRKNFVLIIIQLSEVEIQQSSQFFELL